MCLYSNYKLLSQYFCYLNVCNRNNDVWLKRPFALLFLDQQQQHECRFECLLDVM